MRANSQERMALGVVALLLVMGAAVRWVHHDPTPVRWSAESGAATAHEDTAAADESGAGRRLLARAEGAAADQARRSRPLGADERIDPNTATAADLDRLPRVGAALAGRMVAWRDAHGGFRTLADVDSVEGVGPALLAQLAPHLTLPAAPATPAAPSPRRASAAPPLALASPAAPLDLNTATAAQLEALPRVGPALARRIVEWRERNGPFRSASELEKVPGIGEKTARKLSPLVRVTP